MVHVDVKWSVCGVNKYLTAGAVVFVAFLHRARVPVSPIYSVLKHSQGKRVRQVSVVHRVSVLTIQVRVSDRRNKFRVTGFLLRQDKRICLFSGALTQCS